MTNQLGRHIFITLLLLSISLTVFAQGGRMRMQQMGREPLYRPYNHPNFNRQNNQPGGKQPRIQAIKINYISKQLALSPEQTIRFEAVYRQYLQEQGAVRVLKRLNNSDAQANGADQVNKDLAYERQLVDIKQHYTDEFLKIMPAEKVSVIFKSERQFNDEAVKILNERKPNGPPPTR